MRLSERQWEMVLENLQSRIGDTAYTAWFQPVAYVPDDNDLRLTIALPTPFVASSVEGKYSGDICAAAEGVIDFRPELSFRAQHIPTEQDQKQDQGAHLRTVPEADKQWDMFVPAITEIPIKDDVHLMEIAPFTLQPRGESRTELIYDEVNGINIRIKANQEYGLPSSVDYDLVLMMQSWLADLANTYRRQLARYRAGGEKGKAPAKPPRYFEPSVKEMLLFSRTYEASGRNQRDRVEGMLNRLKGTEVKVSKTQDRRKRRWGSFSFIHDWEILEETETGNILQVKIEIPGWIYEGIVEASTPTILTYDPDYFLIKKPLWKFLYRLFRLYDRHITDDSPNMEFFTADLHDRSRSRREIKDFNKMLSQDVKALDGGQFFQWNLKLEGLRGQRKLVVTRKQKALP